MTTYPNREHENADKTARRRALKALEDIRGEAERLHFDISYDRDRDGDDTQKLSDLARRVTQNLAVLGALREVREWHAADQKDRTDRFSCQGCGKIMTEQGEVADHKNLHGLVINIGPGWPE